MLKLQFSSGNSIQVHENRYLAFIEFKQLTRSSQYEYLEIRGESHSWDKFKKMFLFYFNACHFCGTRDELSIDHKLPKCYFPTLKRKFSNLQTLCMKCNSGKRHSLFSEYGYLLKEEGISDKSISELRRDIMLAEKSREKEPLWEKLLKQWN